MFVAMNVESMIRMAERSLALALGLLLGPALPAETRLLRFPDLHGDRVVFGYGGDLWTASDQGGLAQRLTAHPGLECYPKFSPDGQWIAFTGQYDGDEQVYVMPAQGGVPRQLTFYPATGPLNPWAGSDNQVLGWTPDGRSILFRSMREADGVLSEASLYSVPMAGGPAQHLPVAGAGAGALSLDGRQLAYEPVFRDASNWKRYAGGQARGIELLDLATGARRRVAPSARSERDPMWLGDQLCFNSDRDGTLNLYALNPATGALRRLTHHRTWDVRWPSSDHRSRIIYERDGGLRIFDLAAGRDRALTLTVPSDGGAARPSRVEPELEGWALAPQGERVLAVARGDVFTLPIEHGPVRNLTHSSRAHARLARWSPDGRTIAFTSDRSGEQQVYLLDQAGQGQPRPLGSALHGAVRSLAWAPDGQRLAVVCEDGRFLVLALADGRQTLVARDSADGSRECAWAPDSRHLALTLGQPNGFSTLNIWSAAEGECRAVTSPYFPVRSPSWDPHGRFLYYLSRRSYRSRPSNLEMDFTDTGNWGLFALALARDTGNPFPPESDEVDLGSDLSAKPAPLGPMVIDWPGLEQRVVRVPVAIGNLDKLQAVRRGLLFQREIEPQGDRPARTCISWFDPDRRQESIVSEDATGFETSADGRQVLYRQDSELYLQAVGGRDRTRVSTRNLSADVVPAEEWAEVFEEVWRRYRDLFYARNMHGVDWPAVAERYRPLLKYVTHRSDLTYLLLEMVGELNVGHAFLGGGDFYQPDRAKVGLAGARFELDPRAGRFRIQRIYRGHNEEPKYRSPLTELGVDAREGDYLLAIDGQELLGGDDPYRLLRNRTGLVTLTLNATPTLAGARRVSYRPVESEQSLRYLDFVLRSLDRVQRLSRGQVGYLHLPDMGEAGLAEFIKWFYPQIRCKALVVDVRGNEGGNSSEMILERLSRKLLGASFRRGMDLPDTYPRTVFTGPLVCLMNEGTSSDGELFAAHFRDLGLGPLIGTRTWGGAVGIDGDAVPVKDGGFVWVPEVSSNGADGRWIIEGQGVRPDLEVASDPAALLAGRDPQLERAVAEAMRRLAEHPGNLPSRPADPVRAD
jgi:tricorn protease